MTERERSEGQELSQEERVKLAQRALASFAERFQEQAEAAKSLLEAEAPQFNCTGSAVLINSPDLQKHEIRCDVVFDDGTRLHFEGISPPGTVEPGSVAPSSGVSLSVSGRFFVPPSELVGDDVTFLGDVLGLESGFPTVAFIWWRKPETNSSEPLALFSGTSIGGPFHSYHFENGKGVWSIAPDGS